MPPLEVSDPALGAITEAVAGIRRRRSARAVIPSVHPISFGITCRVCGPLSALTRGTAIRTTADETHIETLGLHAPASLLAFSPYPLKHQGARLVRRPPAAERAA